jgi:hypothetical protein
LASPLSTDEVSLLDGTLLPALERHHLRLLAHSLRTLQRVQQDRGDLQIPTATVLERWLLQQPSLQGEPQFVQLLARQLAGAGQQLEQLAHEQGLAPLQLQLDDLIAWGQRQADQRLASAPPATPQQPPGEQPADR